MTWREHCAPIIARVIREHQGESEAEIRAALREAYPWGVRAHWPYLAWCSEVRKQLGAEARRRGEQCRQEQIDAGQTELPL